MTDLSVHEKGKWLVIGDGTIDEMQISGRWLKADHQAELTEMM